MTRLLLYFLIVIGISSESLAQTSVLNSGKWFKISVKADGIYQIDYNFLKTLGAEPDKIIPSSIKLYTYPNGMLPQANSATRQKDLKELAIVVTGESDGKFNTGDKIYFYGQGPDAHHYDTKKQTFWYENHLYTDKNYYFLSVGGAGGKRLAPQESITGSFPVVNQYLDFAQFEEDTENILHSGREWFGFEFDSKTEATIEFNMAGIIPNSPVTFISKVMARAFAPIIFRLYYNGTEVGSQDVATVANTTYSPKGVMKSDTLHLNSTTIGASNSLKQSIRYQFIKTGTEHSVGFLDNFLISVKRGIALYNDQTIFNLTDGLMNPISSVEIEIGSVSPMVWEVTDPFNCRVQSISTSGTKATFNIESEALKKFAVFNPSKPMTIPAGEGSLANQDIQSLSPANFLIITDQKFENDALRLAAHRASFNGLTSHVVTTHQIYNEYAGGKQDITAIRDFIRDMYSKSSSTLKYVLLFGRGSYDYKGRISANTNYVPVYESRNSLSPLETYSSDDFFGFLEDNEGFWSETDSFDHTLDVGVGRLPVRSAEEATHVVDKLIQYDLNGRARGQWKTEIVFAADDGDFNVHQNQADQLAAFLENSSPSFHVKKIYLDWFPQQTKSFGQISPDATNTLFRSFHEGALIVNFTGHGSEQQWMQERMLDPIFVADTKNKFTYPFLITATCEFGRNDDPLIISSAEKLLLKKESGCIGLVTTSRPVSSATNFEINMDFYDAFLIDNESKGQSIGTVFRVTKNKGNLGVSNRNFSLLGDPATMIGGAEYQIAVTALSNSSGDIDLQGLTTYNLKGEIRKSNQIQNGFNGEVSIRIFNKPTSKSTRGDENPVFKYAEFEQLLFQGKAVVQNGEFDLDFIVPKLDSDVQADGAIKLYATSNDEVQKEATGYSDVSISTINNTLADNKTPTARLFINDTTFVNGGISNENPFLIAQLDDDVGFDISGNPEKLMKVILDGDSAFNVTSYFVSKPGNFNNGTIKFQFFDLTTGDHQIQLTFYDLSGNKGMATVDFVVGELNQLEISELVGWPNPFADKVKIGFFHNRSGEDLLGHLVITTVYGQPIRVIDFEALNSPFSTEFMEWDATDFNGSKVAPGVYILRLSLRSMVDGSKNEAFTKLILSN